MSKPHYDLVQEMSEPHKLGVRTDSAAMLAGFLEIVWRLDPGPASFAGYTKITERRLGEARRALEGEEL